MGFCWRMVPSYTRRDPFRKRGEAIFECGGLIEYFFFLFFSFKVLVNFGKFAGKEYKVSIIENEGNEESLNMEFVFSKNNNLSSKKMEFFNNILNANSPTPSKTNQ